MGIIRLFRIGSMTRVALLLVGCATEAKQEHTKDDTLVFHVVDTDFSKGRLGFEQHIHLDDLVRFHGHLCDGLLMGALAFQSGAEQLFPEGKIDRTSLRIKSKSSPCLTDVAIYLSGGRYQFNTFYVDNKQDAIYEMLRLDTEQAVSITLKKGVKPPEIDQLGAKAIARKLSPCGLDSLRKLEDDFTDFLLSSAPNTLFEVRTLSDFEWNQPLQEVYLKTDILNKRQPMCP